MSLHEFSGTTLKTLLERFFETSFNAIVITTAADGYRIVYANPQFLAMTGYPLAELIGQTPKMLQGEKTSPQIIARLKASLAQGVPFHGATINYRKNGQPYPVEWNISPIRNEHGMVTHYISIQKDLSPLREVVTRLKNTNQHFRSFLRDISLNTEQLPAQTAEVLSQHKQELTEEMLDNAKLYSPALRSAENIELFGDTEFFDADNDLFGMLGDDTPQHIISAAQYCQEFGSKADISELINHIEDTRGILDILPYSKNLQADMQVVGQNLQDMANEVFYFEDFVEISSALAELAQRTSRNAGQMPSAMIIEVYQALMSDLRAWVNSVFIARSALNIHEMDASIISSARQLLILMK